MDKETILFAVIFLFLLFFVYLAYKDQRAFLEENKCHVAEVKNGHKGYKCADGVVYWY